MIADNENEQESMFFATSFIEQYLIYTHNEMKDLNEEYSRQHKKRKGNEQTLYKDLRDRNALLTIYRAVSYDQPDQQNNINKIIQWLQNQQKIILPRSEKDKVGEKSFLKHILTQQCQKLPDQNINDEIKQNPTLAHYVNEAHEKQAEGFVNNVLIMVQPIKIPNQTQYVNYFAQSVAYQMKQSKKPLIMTEPLMRCNKVIFINLSGKESLHNLELWQQNLEKGDEFIYFSFIKIHGNNEKEYETQFQEYSNYFKNMDQANFSYFLLPYFCLENQNTLHGQLIKSFFYNFMYNRIEKFTHRAYIALSLSLSDDIDYDPFGIQYLINNLIKLSNDKLMIHIDIEIKEEENNKYMRRLTQLMNLCYSSFQEQNIQIQTLLPQDKIELSEIINRLNKIYVQFKLENLHKSFQYNEIAMRNLKQEIQKIKNTPTESGLMKLQSIFYKKNSQNYLIINPILENNDQITPQTQIIINYQDEIIVLYQNGKNKYLYFLQIKMKHFYSNNLIEKIQFTNLSKHLEPNDINNQIVFYCNYHIFVLYGDQENSLIMRCLKYSIKQSEITILTFNEQEKLNQTSFHLKIAIQKFTSEQQLIEKLKARVSPTVCIENYTDQLIKVVLFGGENIESPQIMNLIEYIEIKDQSFTSGILDKSNLFKDLSFKPYPGQTILNIKYTNDILYLILPGNDILRKNSLNHPINSQFSQNAILMRKGLFDFSVSNIPIKYYGEVKYELSQISNSQQNSQLIFLEENLALWRVIYTQTMKIESIQKLKLDYSQAQESKNINTELFPKKDKLFKQQKHEMEMILAYYIEIYKELNENDIIQCLEKKKEFDQQKQSSKEDTKKTDYQMKIDYYKKKLEEGQLLDLTGNPFILKDKMQEERGNLYEQQQNQQEFFKSNVLENYDGDTNQLYSVAYENYLYLDFQTKQLSVKQFTYLIGDALSLPSIDLTNQDCQDQEMDDARGKSIKIG